MTFCAAFAIAFGMSDTSDSSHKVAEKIDSGEFFRESMRAYDISYHDDMTDRYFFIGITCIAVLIFLLSVSAIIAMHPLSKEVPFIYTSNDIVEDYPKIKPLGERDEDPNYLLQRFLVTNYVQLWEEYSVDTVERNEQGIASQSTEDVLAKYRNSVDPRNPQSPIKQFQRNAVRKVDPVSYELLPAADGAERMVVNYKEQVIAGKDVSSRLKRAIITFRFDHIRVNQETGEATPFKFLVTGYETEVVN